MPERLTYDIVKKIFDDNNYKLISTEYINSSSKLLTICPNNHEYYVSYNKFQQGRRCPICLGIKKYTIDEVREIFEIEGCKLLSNDYENNRSKLQYECSCGNISYISLDSFIRGSRCKKCGYKKNKEKQIYSYEYVQNKFEENGYILLSENYDGYNRPLECICPNGHKINKTLASLEFGYDCRLCANDNLKYNYNDLQEFYKKQGCELLTTEDEYNGIGHNNSLKYKCVCGNITQTTFQNFRNGERCWECGKLKKEETNLLRYNVRHTLSNKEVWKKTRDSLFKNKTAPCSQQQRYLCKLFNGLLNYPIGGYNVDILLDNNIVVEYDGGGHKLSVIMQSISQEDFNKKEKRRNYYIYRKGYKLIRIISSCDFLPYDVILLQMIEKSKQYFQSGHSWIYFDIDNSKFINSTGEYDYDFGKLRRINKKNL